MLDNPERARLATHLRDATGLSGNRFATERIDWPQSRVSRLETGTQLPTEDDIHAWVTAAGARSEAAAELLELLEQARIEVVAQRMSRQQALYQPGKQIQLVMGEAALHNSVGTIATLLGQLAGARDHPAAERLPEVRARQLRPESSSR